ncbi:MAG: hypothetical protein HY509_05270 [Acidobacteria bacterium]|nr:hypothetical protein [Acidobacteriota bacterium]
MRPEAPAAAPADRRWWALPAFVAAGALGAGVFLDAQVRLDSLQAGRGAGYRLLYLPNGKYLKAISLGFSQLWADAIYLWSIQFYSEGERAGRAEYLEHIFAGVLAELDPHYLDPYMTGALIMAMEAGDAPMALRLLDLGLRNNPDSWLLAADAGFYAYLELRDYDRAEAYFRRAAGIRGAPRVLGRLVAGMADRRGAKAEAYRTWLEIYENAEDDYTRRISFLHVHDLKIDLDLERLRTAIGAYRERHGGFPDDLGRLVETGWLPSLPTDPRQLPYRYDPGTGRVTCATPFALKSRV